jgi:hypothetical protein
MEQKHQSYHKERKRSHMQLLQVRTLEINPQVLTTMVAVAAKRMAITTVPKRAFAAF